MALKHWKTLERKEVFKHPRMHLVEDDVMLPDGNTAKYLRHAPVKAHSVGIIAVNDKQEVLLQREYSYPPNKVMWQLPGGGMQENESVEVAANRELSEESGLAAQSVVPIGSFYTNNRRSDEVQYIVLCTHLQPKAGQKDAEEFIESEWVPVADLQAMIARGEFVNINLLAALSLWFAKQR